MPCALGAFVCAPGDIPCSPAPRWVVCAEAKATPAKSAAVLSSSLLFMRFTPLFPPSGIIKRLQDSEAL
jgi:hypothetical protein